MSNTLVKTKKEEDWLMLVRANCVEKKEEACSQTS